jgi:signal transduction histidine kinase
MSSKTNKATGTAAWRIASWATLAFAIGMAGVCSYFYAIVLHSLRERSDRWLSGEVEVLADVAQKTPKNNRYDRIVGEVAELATTEAPRDSGDATDPTKSVFFAQLSPGGEMTLWVGPSDKQPYLAALGNVQLQPGTPETLEIKSFYRSFRVVRQALPDGSSVFLGYSEHTTHSFLSSLRIRFLILWFGIVAIGFAFIFMITRRMLMRVQQITKTAASIDQSNLSGRVPVRLRNDEITLLAITFNRMLDRIENTVGQLHTITGALAHDIKSPLTSLRGKLELALLQNEYGSWSEPVASALEEVDRLSEFLNRYLDVSEAKANALRLRPEPIEFRALVETMIELFLPSMSEKDLTVELNGTEPFWMNADRTLMQRMLTNLFDNEVKHVPPHTALGVPRQWPRLSGGDSRSSLSPLFQRA